MQIYPALDLRGGQVVRLLQGDYARQTDYALDAVTQAQSYAAQGADWLHVVDLDAAKSSTQASANLDVVAAIAKSTSLKIQFGGGVRTLADVQQRLDMGCARVVVGSVAIRDPDLVCGWLAQVGPEKLCLALDCRADLHGVFRVHVAGWQEAAEAELFESVARFTAAGFKHALVTDIACDGMLAGPNVALYAKLAKSHGGLLVQASGGVATLSDLRALRANRVAGVIIGKALLEARFDVAQALTC